MASGGQRPTPRLVREVVDVVSGQRRATTAAPMQAVAMKPENLAVIRDAMVGVNKEGTSATAFRDAAYVAAGKTGTAQVVGIKQNEKYNASQLNERFLDHALYIAFAPADAPRVAVALVVENAGFGAQAAAPIARRVFDFVLQGLTPSDDDIALTQTGKSAAPVGSRPAASGPLLAASSPAGFSNGSGTAASAP